MLLSRTPMPIQLVSFVSVAFKLSVKRMGIAHCPAQLCRKTREQVDLSKSSQQPSQIPSNV